MPSALWRINQQGEPLQRDEGIGGGVPKNVLFSDRRQLFFAKHLLWTNCRKNDFPHVSPNRETEASGMKGAQEVTHLGRDSAEILLPTNHLGWPCTTHCTTLPQGGDHTEAISEARTSR